MDKDKNFLNESDKEFIDISSETYRIYTFPNNEKITIQFPLKLSVSPSGHRIWDGKFSYFIPTGWICLAWEVKDGSPHFVK